MLPFSKIPEVSLMYFSLDIGILDKVGCENIPNLENQISARFKVCFTPDDTPDPN